MLLGGSQGRTRMKIIVVARDPVVSSRLEQLLSGRDHMVRIVDLGSPDGALVREPPDLAVIALSEGERSARAELGSLRESLGPGPFVLAVCHATGHLDPAIWVEGGADDFHRGLDSSELLARVTLFERRLARRGDAASSGGYRPALEIIPDIVLTIDATGKILFLNRTVAGFRMEGVLGTSVYQYVPPEQHDLLRTHIERVFATGDPQRYEIAGPGATWYESQISAIVREGAVVAAVIIARDATDRKRAIRALEESEARARAVEENFRRVIDRLPDGVALHRNGRILYVNAAWVAALGYASESELIGTEMLSYIHPDERALVARRMRQVAETGLPASAGEFRLLRKDGGVVNIEVSPVHRIEFEGSPANLVVARDVTQRKAMQERLLMSERLACMGSLAACIAHEINNPLTYVIGNLGRVAEALASLSREGDSWERRGVERSVADAREGAERIRRIVADLGILSQLEEDSGRPIDVRRILESSINVAWNEIRHRARLEREFGETPLVFANDARLGQVFLSLLLNAARAIPEGTAVHNVVRISTGTDASGGAFVEIRDTGFGVSPDLRGGGGGLGLAICQSIITGFGGELRVNHDPEKGGSLLVRLPAARGAAQVQGRLEEGGGSTAKESGRARILVVDDEPVIAALVSESLDPHDVYIVTSGRDALEMCRNESFDLVLCDLMMPDLTGMDLYEQLRIDQSGCEKRIIFMTGGAFTQRAKKFLSCVPNPCVSKPFSVEEIRSVVERYFGREVARG